MRKFVLQAADPATGCPALETRFCVEDLLALRAVLAPACDDDPNLSLRYPLEADQVRAISSSFDVTFDAGDRETTLEPWHALRELPYLVHTGFELALMIDGRKPLAAFSDCEPAEWLDEIARRFAPFVREGRFVTRTITQRIDPFRSATNGSLVERRRDVYFATRGQEWRIDAYMKLRETLNATGWNDDLERQEGALLGYEAWQNDYWIEWRKRRKALNE